MTTHPMPSALDFQGIGQLKAEARRASPEALDEAARQFEAVFLGLLLKNMRNTVPDGGLWNGAGKDTAQSLYDQQLATHLAGHAGFGLAERIAMQLRGGMPPVTEPPATAQASALPPQTTVAPKEALDTATPEAFAQSVWPHARRAGDALGVDPAVLVAQAALETGWGRHVPRRADGGSSHNLFGIKAGGQWQGDTALARTVEFEGDRFVPRREAFRAYPSVAAAFDDYAALLQAQPRYREALAQGKDPAAFATALQEAGYATDPGYADKIRAVLASAPLQTALKSAADGPLNAART